MDSSKENVHSCSQTGCRRQPCVSINITTNNFEQFCLLHFYGTKYCQDEFKGKTIILNKHIYEVQKIATTKILNRVMQEIEDELKDINTKASKKRNLASTITNSSQNLDSEKPVTQADADSQNKPNPKFKHLWNIKQQKKDETFRTKASSLIITGEELNALNLTHVVPSEKNRRKVACMLKAALETSRGAQSSEEVAETALAIEARLFIKYRPQFAHKQDSEEKSLTSTRAEYTKHARMLFNQLKDPLNGHLRSRLLSGELKPDQICAAGSEDLLNPKAKQHRKSMQEKIMLQRTKGKLLKNTGSKTDSYECPNCRNNRQNVFTPLQPNSAHIAKFETWGNKDSLDSNKFRVICSNCNFEFFR